MKSHFEVLTAENALNLKGGHTVKICMDIEVKHCMVVEAIYCGPEASSLSASKPTEFKGPVDPWGK